MAAQTQAQLDDENVLNHVDHGFPMDSDAGQALKAAGVKSVKDLVLLANLYGRNG